MISKTGKFLCASAISLALATAITSQVAAEPGVHADRIVFGQSAALDGPAMALGTGMREGILAAFEEENRNGGVNGRRLELISYDDGYEPDRAVKQTNKLIKKDKVFGLIGGVGTPTSKVAQPIATKAGVPYIGPFTGAGFLRAAELDNVVNVRGTYDQETEAWILHLTEILKYDRIAIFYQDDSFGKAGLSGVKKALTKRGLKLVAEGTYKRNTVDVGDALAKIKAAKPQAIVTVGAYKPIAAFIKQARGAGIQSLVLNISFVGSKALAKELAGNTKNVVITQVVPFPWDATLPVVKKYQAAMKAVNAEAEYGFVSLEGYMVGRLAIMALKKTKGDLTRKNFLKTVKKVGYFNLGGVVLNYGPDDNQGMDRVFLTIINPDGSFKSVHTLDDLG